MSFSSRLKAVRCSRGMNQKEFAALLGFSPVTLSHYENEKREPDLQKLTDICLTLSVSSDYLLGLSDCMTPTHCITIPPTSQPRHQFDDLTDDQRIMIESTLAAFRAANAAAVSKQEA